ncbi:MerR family transcriptional regulator [Mycoplasmatota bacterium]|nr:MerR family transcriptional regulator [Mycoplasmatota bacterium]
MKKYFSIGETAKINNVSIQALRHYDKIGLLKPAYVDPESKYRYYSLHQFIYLDLIKYSKHIGATLKEISNVLQDKNVVTLLSFLNKQQSVIEKEINRLNKMNNAIGHIKDQIKYAVELKETNEIYFRELEKRFIIDIELNKKDEYSDVEIKIRKLDKIMEENEIMLQGEVGCFINLDLFINKGKFCYKSVYSTLCIDDIGNNNLDIKQIKEGKFICISYLSKEREQAVDKLSKYIKENNIKYKGVGLEIQLFNTIEPCENTDLYELQILI